MKMTNLCTLDSTEVFKMFDYIQKFTKDGEDKKEFALNHVRNFFDHMNIQQEIELFDILDNRDYNKMNEFIKRYPTMPVNLDGDSKITHQSGCQAKALALETSYIAVTQKDMGDKGKQVRDARELKCLRNVKAMGYGYEKARLLKQYGKSGVLTSLNLYEDELTDYPQCKKLLALVFAYFYKHPGKTTFLEYVFYYLDVIRLDKKNECPLKEIYLKTIDELLKNKNEA